MNILAIKTNEGYYLNSNEENRPYHYSPSISGLYINGVKLEPTWHKDWFFSKEEPKVITKLTSQPNINHRYELKDPDTFPNLKRVYQRDEVFLGYDDDDDAIFSESFIGIASLYQQKSDPVPAKHVEVEFELKLIAEIETIEKPGEFSFEAIENRRVKEIKSPHYFAIHQVLTPPIAIHETPCFLTSKESYEIVRQYVKSNINPKVARITSDYDFCFAVKKLVSIKPYTLKTEVKKSNGRSYAKPRFNEKFIKNKEYPFFEMTHDEADRGSRGKGYGDYTILSGFKGENQEDLKQTIDAYLGDLITSINKPMAECDHCSGTGINPEE